MRLRKLLLDLLSTHRRVSPEKLDQLSDTCWKQLLTIATEHRVVPLLYWRLIQESQLKVPEPVFQYLQQCFQQANLKHLAQIAQLIRIDRIFNDAGIPYVALKGSQLLAIYPHSALRVMRDLDILVPETHVMAAYQLLRERGYYHPKGYERDIDACIRLHKHLPNMLDPTGQVMIELHIRTLHIDDFPQQDLIDEPGFWQRTRSITLTGQNISVMSETDLLLHLIIHSCYDHLFNNGPLFFSDIFYLLQTSIIDWSLFWAMAEKRQVTDGCILALSMMTYYYGMQSIEWPDNVSSSQRQAIAQQAPEFSLLTLQNYFYRGKQKGLGSLYQQAALKEKAKLLFNKLFPSRQVLGVRYPVSSKSNKVWGYYLYHWGYLILQLFYLIRLRNATEINYQARQIAKLRRFLSKK